MHPWVTEKQFQAAVVEYAQIRGWTYYHTADSRKSAPGFPDLVFVRYKVIFAELKVGKNKLSKHQKHWRDVLLEANANWFCWYPDDWPEIEQELL